MIQQNKEYRFRLGGSTQKGFYKYSPRNKEELKTLMDILINERGNDADFNDIETYGITDMSYLFKGKKDFNGDISKWCVDEVKNMEGMFENAKAFNQDISNWDVSNVVDMSGMFMCASSFNQPIGTWNIKRVCNMSYMFEYATAFNQDLSKWKGMSVNTEDMFVGSGLEGNEPAWYK